MSVNLATKTPVIETRGKILPWVKANPNCTLLEMEKGLGVRKAVLSNVLTDMLKDGVLTVRRGSVPPHAANARKGSVYFYTAVPESPPVCISTSTDKPGDLFDKAKVEPPEPLELLGALAKRVRDLAGDLETAALALAEQAEKNNADMAKLRKLEALAKATIA